MLYRQFCKPYRGRLKSLGSLFNYELYGLIIYDRELMPDIRRIWQYSAHKGVIVKMKRIDSIVFATNNQHKLEEARQILGNHLHIISLKEIGCEEDIPEDQDTIEGNALQKARWIRDRYNVACVADDTGLFVDVLDGAPGVHSARYAGDGHDAIANMNKLLTELKAIRTPDSDGSLSTARFRTALAYVTPEGNEIIFEGAVEGKITDPPRGNSGFGYDPVFQCDSTGRTFAEMLPEEKHAVSHRGRAFRKFRDMIEQSAIELRNKPGNPDSSITSTLKNSLKTLLVIVVALLSSFALPAAQWRSHASYDGQVIRAIDTKKFTYFLTSKQNYNPLDAAATVLYGALLRYDKEADEWKWIDKSTGLSETLVVAAEYDYNNSQLIIGYDNGNIDLLKDNGEIVNIPGLMMAGGNASSEIRNIAVSPDNGNIWITTSSGYVNINPIKGEVITSRNYSRPIRAVVEFGNRLIVATDNSIYYGDPQDASLDNFKLIGNMPDIHRFITLGKERLYIHGGPEEHRDLQVLTGSDNNFSITPYGRGTHYSAEATPAGLVVWGLDGFHWTAPDGETVTRPKPSIIDAGPYRSAASFDGKNLWVTDQYKGFYRFAFPTEGDDQWKMTLEGFYPNSSRAFRCVAMTWHPQYGMLVRNHGSEQKFVPIYKLTPDLLSALNSGSWTPMSAPRRDADPEAVFRVFNPDGLAIDPRNSDHVYCGSFLTGILRLDLKDPSNSLHLSRSNDAGAGKPGFVAITEPLKVWDQLCSFASPKFDSYGTLWTSYFDADNSSDVNLWYWTADDRLASSSSSFHPLKKLKIGRYTVSGQQLILPLNSSANANRIIHISGEALGIPVTVYDHNGTLDNTSDDRVVSINNLIDRDGNSFNYGRSMVLYEDVKTNRVWVGGESGVYNFSPSSALSGDADIKRVKVSRNDGTGLADYLLDGAYITSIIEDPSGNKWFGTLGAGIVITSSDGSNIIRSYTVDNSEILDNNVHGIGYNKGNNSMIISTAKGLCEVFLNGTSAEENPSPRAYPNPVRPEYLGLVHIDQLPMEAAVKVLDSAGRLIKQLDMADTGETTWDLTDMNFKRVPGGIYYILGTNGPNSDSYNKMTKILVVE